MAIELDHERHGGREVEKRASELETHTNLSETEAFVYAAREQGVGLGAWSHSIISDYLDGGESASQNHLVRAKEKAQQAKATHNLLNKTGNGPKTGNTALPLLDPPTTLSDEEVFMSVTDCEFWMERGITVVYDGEMDVDERKQQLLNEVEKRGIQEEYQEYVHQKE